MSLLPKINLSVGNTCNKVSLIESTSAYVMGTNDGGWGSPNIDTSSVDTSIVNIYDFADTVVLQSFTLKDNLIDLYSLATNPNTPAEFTIIADTNWTQPDGIFKVEYEVTTNTDTYSNTTYQLFLCNLCNCRDNLIVKLIDACSVPAVKQLKDQVDQMEIFIYGIQTAFGCQDFDTADSILTAAATYCQTLTDCGDCGCGGKC